MKKVLFLLLLFISAISSNCLAQTLAEMKGTFQGDFDGLQGYLVLDPTAPTVESKGCLKLKNNTNEIIKVANSPIPLKCYGKLVLRQSGVDMIYNVIAVRPADEIDPASMVIVFEDDTNPDELKFINMFTEDGGKTLQLNYMNDEDNPLFESVTVERYND